MYEEVKSKSILEMCKGAFIERADYEIPGIIKNISDENTSDKAKRTMTITFTFIPRNDRQQIDVECIVKSKLAPTKPIATSLYVAGNDSSGEPQVIEMVPQVPGQFDMSGSEQEAPPMLKIISTS